MMNNLLHPVQEIIRQLLIDLGMATQPEDTGEWPAHKNREPAKPDNCITCYRSTGGNLGRIQFTGEYEDQHPVQIRLRSDDSLTGEEKCESIKHALDTQVNRRTVVVGSTEYLIHSISRPAAGWISLGQESPTTRYLFTYNITAAIERMT